VAFQQAGWRGLRPQIDVRLADNWISRSTPGDLMTPTACSTLDQHAQAASRLPAMPEVAQRLLRSFERDDLSLTAVAELIGKDPSLSAKVLRLANSARYSPTRTVSSLNDAAASLGMRSLRDLTLAACFSTAFPDVRGFDRLAFWRGNMALAVYAQTLARALDVDEDAAYIAGLTLRTGEVLMLMVDADVALDLQKQSVAIDSRIGIETAMLGFSHPQVSARLASAWRFPAEIVAAFEAAVDPLEAKPFSRLGACMRLASTVTDARERGVDAGEALQAAQAGLVEHLKLDLAWVAAHLPAHALATAGVEALLH
jgi:HD-like signal output (HDOD) protein